MENLLIYFIGSAIIAVLMFVVRHKLSNYLLYIPFISLQIAFTIDQAFHLNEITLIYFKTDEIGLIFLSLLTLISIPTIIHASISAERKKNNVREIAIHNAALVIFITTMSGVLICAHVGLMWAFLEATTLSAAALIYHERDNEALEAVWKYVFVASIGIALAFLGILFLGVASQDAETPDLSIDALTRNAASMNPIWLKMCFLFVVTGFSVKVGTVPLFTVDIDAKDTAPSAIGALFSGGLLNVGFVAILRFYQIFAHTSIFEWMNTVLMIVGMSSIFFATVYLLKVKNYKRMFAYSSVEHAGIAMIALAAGGVGYFAAILHLILHSLVKSSLFFQSIQVQQVFMSKNIEQTGGYLQRNPWGGVVLILGFISITAMPPSGLFISEMLTFKALIDANYIGIAIAVVVLLCFIIYGAGKNFLHILFKPLPENEYTSKVKLNPFESLSQWILLALVILIGVYPPGFLVDFIETAVENLPNMIKL